MPLSGFHLRPFPVLYYIIRTGTYCTVSLLFIFTSLCRQTFIRKYLNNEQYENKCNQLCTVVYLQVPFVMKFPLCTPTGEMNNMIREIFIYACILELKITVSGHRCYYVFPLS